MTKVLAIFNHRPEKVANILPYSGLEYDVVSRIVRDNQQKRYHPAIRLAVLPVTILSFKRDHGYHDLIKKYDPDIVFSHGGGPTTPVIRATHKLGKKFVMRIGGHVYEEFRDNMNVPGINRLMMKPVHGTHYHYMIQNLQEADHIIVVSKDMKAKLVNRYGYDPSKLSIVPVPIHLNGFSQDHIPHPHKVVLTIGNMNFLPKVRAILDFAPYMARILKNHQEVVWGVVVPGRYENEVRKELWKYQNDRIHTSGFVRNVGMKYRRADVVAYFSYLDSVPNIVLEAWASKVPVLANRCDWTEELMTSGETALLVNKPNELERSLMKLLNSKTTRKNITRTAYDYLLKHHTEEVAGKKLGEVMRSL